MTVAQALHVVEVASDAQIETEIERVGAMPDSQTVNLLSAIAASLSLDIV
jgi:hypothetical protein